MAFFWCVKKKLRSASSTEMVSWLLSQVQYVVRRVDCVSTACTGDSAVTVSVMCFGFAFSGFNIPYLQADLNVPGDRNSELGILNIRIWHAMKIRQTKTTAALCQIRLLSAEENDNWIDMWLVAGCVQSAQYFQKCFDGRGLTCTQSPLRSSRGSRLPWWIRRWSKGGEMRYWKRGEEAEKTCAEMLGIIGLLTIEQGSSTLRD